MSITCETEETSDMAVDNIQVYAVLTKLTEAEKIAAIKLVGRYTQTEEEREEAIEMLGIGNPHGGDK